jgi:hypothetical protein
VFLILNRVPVTGPELIRPSIPVMSDAFYGPESDGEKGEGKKCTAKILGNMQAEVAQAYNFFFFHPTSQEQFPKVHQRYTKVYQNVCDKSS